MSSNPQSFDSANRPPNHTLDHDADQEAQLARVSGMTPLCVTHVDNTRGTGFVFCPSRKSGISWREILELEPRLLTLCRRARDASVRFGHRRPRAFWRDYESLKRGASRYVGWHAKREALASSHAYEIVIRQLAILMQAHKGARR